MSQTYRPTCYMSELFGEHDPGRGHPERPERYAAVAAAVEALGCPVEDAPPAGPEALERVHAGPMTAVNDQVPGEVIDVFDAVHR